MCTHTQAHNFNVLVFIPASENHLRPVHWVYMHYWPASRTVWKHIVYICTLFYFFGQPVSIGKKNNIGPFLVTCFVRRRSLEHCFNFHTNFTDLGRVLHQVESKKSIRKAKLQFSCLSLTFQFLISPLPHPPPLTVCGCYLFVEHDHGYTTLSDLLCVCVWFWLNLININDTLLTVQNCLFLSFAWW